MRGHVHRRVEHEHEELQCGASTSVVVRTVPELTIKEQSRSPEYCAVATVHMFNLPRLSLRGFSKSSSSRWMSVSAAKRTWAQFVPMVLEQTVNEQLFVPGKLIGDSRGVVSAGTTYTRDSFENV